MDQEQPPAALPVTPVSGQERIVALDVLRGFAVLGILMVNIQSFGLVDALYMNPTALGPLEGSEYWLWWFTYVLFDSKFMTIFSLLFGAGIVLMWERMAARGKSNTWLHYRRMGVLAIMGLAHGQLLWYGDILFLYSICGSIVFLMRGWRPGWLLIVGILLLSMGSGISVLTGLSVPFWDEEQKAEMLQDWSPTPEVVDAELAAFRGGWLDQQPYRSEGALFMHTFLIGFWGIWRAGGLMLIGMALYKWQVFSAAKTNAFYWRQLILCLALGWGIVCWGVWSLEARQWSFDYAFFLGTQLNYWGSVAVSLGYVSFWMLACREQWLGWLRQSLASVGQMALTNYLTHTVVCTTLFYGHGFGWYGHLSRVQLLLVVLVIWLAQLLISPWWLARFRFGPAEWIWRCLSYGKLHPIRRSAPSDTPANVT